MYSILGRTSPFSASVASFRTARGQPEPRRDGTRVGAQEGH